MTKVTTSLTAEDLASRVNSLQYIMYNMIDNTVKTIIIVKVVKVDGDRIDVENVIQDLSNDGEPIGNYIIPSVRYLKWQYGKNCLDAVPEVGDIGLLLVSKQDTSGLNKEGESIVQSDGIFNLGSGIYIGGLFGMNQEPTQFIHFEDDKIDITGTGTININAPTVNIKTTTANIESSGTATVKGDTVNVEATTALNLGGVEGSGVARIGDSIDVVTGKITGGSSLVKSL